MPRELKAAIFHALKNEMLDEFNSLSESDLRENLGLIEALISDEPHAQLLMMIRIMEDQEVFHEISDSIVRMAAPAAVEDVKANVLAYYGYVWQTREAQANAVQTSAEVLELSNHA
jgi:hypothetical protein